MKLSDFFSLNIVKDGEFLVTNYANSNQKEIFCFVLNDEFIDIANKNTNVTCVITYPKYSKLFPSKGLVTSNNPKRDFFITHNKAFVNGKLSFDEKWSINKTARIDPTAIIGKNVHIGKNSIIDKRAIVEDNTYIGSNVYVGMNAIIGARGLHDTRFEGEHDLLRVYDAGGVRVGDNSEILANAIVQKSYFKEFTEIGSNTILSVNVNIAHGVSVGNNTLIAGHSMISGFSKIGNNVWIGPNSTISSAISIEDNCKVRLGSVVINDMSEGDDYSGNFAYEHTRNLKNFIKQKR